MILSGSGFTGKDLMMADPHASADAEDFGGPGGIKSAAATGHGSRLGSAIGATGHGTRTSRRGQSGVGASTRRGRVSAALAARGQGTRKRQQTEITRNSGAKHKVVKF